MTTPARPFRAALLPVIAALLGPACGARSTQATDTKTNWLTHCDDDNPCDDGATCMCGVCTRECNSAADCSSVDPQAGCFSASHCTAAKAVCALSVDDLGAPAAASTSFGSDASVVTGATELPTTAAFSSEGQGSSVNEPTSSAGTSASPTSSQNSNSSSECDDPSRTYLSHDTELCQRAEPNCAAGSVEFADACGCGCRTLPEDAGATGESSSALNDSTDGGTADAGVPVCPPPPAGSPINYTVVAQLDCNSDPIVNQFVASTTDLTAALGPYCYPKAMDVAVDSLLYVAAFPYRSSAGVDYVVDDGTSVHVGMSSDVYCGGAVPPTKVFLLQLDGVSATAQVTPDFCTLGECVGPPVP